MKISIITVTFNSVSFINDCLKSIKNQNYKNIEHIVIDGASTDGTVSLLESKRGEFSMFVSENDDGIYDAMNKGLNFATGDVIGFLNSDDFYENNYVISSVMEEFKKDPSLEACYADLLYVNRSDTSKSIRYFKSSKFTRGLFSKGWCPPHPTFFVRKSIYKKFGKFDLNYTIASDVELMMRFLEVHQIKSLYVPEIWVKMRMGGTTNKSLRNIFLQNFEILKALHKNGLSINLFKFFIFKLVSRFNQFYTKQT